jgi:CheY-like chemotaxis protein
MPGMDGVEATRRLRALQAEGRLRPFPIVALTAHALASDRQSSLDAGMDEHLTKPMQFDTLRTVLDQWRPDDLQLDDDEEDEPSAN